MSDVFCSVWCDDDDDASGGGDGDGGGGLEKSDVDWKFIFDSFVNGFYF